MDYKFDDYPVPSDFKYTEVLKEGKPVHVKYDNFYLKHPPMELSRRAKIFAPFDALKGFRDAIEEKNG